MEHRGDHQPQPPAENLRWERVLAFRPLLAADGPGEWVPLGQQDDGSFTLPYATLSDTASRFVAVLYEVQVVTSFDWSSWMTVRGGELCDSPSEIDGCSLEDCRRLLAAVVRGDRFSEGALLGALEDGIVDRILGRVAELTGGGARPG